MATIKDVASEAGVSTATVSYVINNSRPVSDARRNRVLEAIATLNYHPNRRAQGLRSGRTSTVGLIVDDITNRFASHFIQGFEARAADSGYTTIISDLQRNPKNEDRSLNMLVGEEVDGIVYAGLGRTEEQLIRLFQSGLPVVVVDKPPVTKKLPTVLIDNEQSIVSSMEHLMQFGHTKILFITGLKINKNSEIRVQTFLDFQRRHELDLDGDSVYYGDYTLDHGYQTTLRILEEKRDFSAILCGDDIIAFAVIAALRSKGVRVPEEVAVIGFDDDPMASIFDPTLTTIHYPMKTMGDKAFSLLMKYISGKRKRPEHIMLDTKLVVRRSTNSDYQDYYTGLGI